ncbi:MAG: hypothetical protein AAGN82_17890, partial [Myxococcota bacterium]
MTATTMNRRIAFLACDTTLPGGERRRADAHEFDRQYGGLGAAFAARGIELRAVDWARVEGDLHGCDAVVIGTPWNYQDHEASFLRELRSLEDRGFPLFNPSEVVAWNTRKSYLRDLAAQGIPIVPTRWVDEPTADDVAHVFADHGDTDAVVVKRQVGAGAEGQRIFRRGERLDAGPLLDRPAMLQPFVPAIRREGELSFVFIDGALSHVVRKRPRPGDYRVQSLFGGSEHAIARADDTDVAAARAVLDAVPFSMPLYARI